MKQKLFHTFTVLVLLFSPGQAEATQIARVDACSVSVLGWARDGKRFVVRKVCRTGLALRSYNSRLGRPRLPPMARTVTLTLHDPYRATHRVLCTRCPKSASGARRLRAVRQLRLTRRGVHRIKPTSTWGPRGSNALDSLFEDSPRKRTAARKWPTVRVRRSSGQLVFESRTSPGRWRQIGVRSYALLDRTLGRRRRSGPSYSNRTSYSGRGVMWGPKRRVLLFRVARRTGGFMSSQTRQMFVAFPATLLP